MKSRVMMELLAVGSLGLAPLFGCTAETSGPVRLDQPTLPSVSTPGDDIPAPPIEREAELRRIFEDREAIFTDEIARGEVQATAFLGLCIALREKRVPSGTDDYRIYILPSPATIDIEIDAYTSMRSIIIPDLDGDGFVLSDPGVIYNPEGLHSMDGMTETTFNFGQEYENISTAAPNGFRAIEGIFTADKNTLIAPEGYLIGAPLVSFENSTGRMDEIPGSIADLITEMCTPSFSPSMGDIPPTIADA